MACPCPKHPFGCYGHPHQCGCEALKKSQASRIEELEADRMKQIDYSVDLQRIIEDLCHERAIREPATGARYHYDLAVKYRSEVVARAEKAERALAEAVVAIKLGLDVISEERGWGTYPRMEGSEIYADAAAFAEAARAFVKAQEGA